MLAGPTKVEARKNCERRGSGDGISIAYTPAVASRRNSHGTGGAGHHPRCSAAGGHLRLSPLQRRQFAQPRLLHPDSQARRRSRRRHGQRHRRLRHPSRHRQPVIGVPIGIGGGIFLAEFGRGTKLANAVRFTADVLNGVPSIVMGLAVYALIVVPQSITSRLSRAAWRWAS